MHIHFHYMQRQDLNAWGALKMIGIKLKAPPHSLNKDY